MKSKEETKEQSGVLEKFANMVVEKLSSVLKPDAPSADVKLEEDTKLAQMKLKGGEVIEAEAFEKDQRVFVLVEGERVPAPEGEHMLEDGRTLVVEREGVISEIRESEEVEETEEEMNPMEERMSKLETQLSELTKSFQEFSQQKAETEQALSEKDKELEEVKAQLSEQPSSSGVDLAPIETEVEPLSEADLSRMSAHERYLYNTKNLKN